MVSVNWSNVSSFSEIPSLANQTTGNYFWSATIFMIWILLMIMLSFFGFEVSILVSTFLALVIGILLVYANLLAWETLLIFVGILFFMFLYIIWSSNKTKQ